MLSRKFMQAYVSFIAMSLTVATVGPAYYFLTKYLPAFVSEDYSQTVAVALGVVATVVAYQMMAVIEENKTEVVEDAEKMADWFRA